MAVPGGGKQVGIWVVTALLAAVFMMAGGAKLSGHPEMVANFARWGYPAWFRVALGGAEVALALLLLVPRTAWLGAAGIVVVMVGATYTHAIIEGKFGPAAFTVVLGLLSAFVGWVRRPENT